MNTPNRSETFGRLLKAGISSIANCEGKTAPVVEDELGTQIGVAGKSIQRYKAGHLPPEARTVQILAEACVRRGMMGREWLEAFLHHARYPFADRLLDQLRPLGSVRPRPPRVYENLPAPTYSQFVMRAQVFAEVLDGLQQRSAAVLIVGMGGNGKTSLAREVAARCLRDDDEAPRFDAVVWVSDKDRPGTTNLSTVLDEIARTLDYPGFTQFEHEEKRREVEQLLRRQSVLLVVDNFETVTDGALLTWLLRLPEPSKALITTREYRREWRSSWPVELRGMSEAEAWELISERARVLKIDRLVGERAELEPLLAATGGNPKALTMTLGLLKYERRPLQQVVDDLYAARGDLFDDLFTRAWALLDEAARRVLLVATFFLVSASTEALQATADVQGFAFDRAVERLADLALLDVQQAELSNSPRYALHPLVRAFAGAKLAEQPGFEVVARERWVDWYRDLTSSVGWCWDNLPLLDILDPEQETIFAAMQQTLQRQQYHTVTQFARGVSYYYYLRGLWDKKLSVDMMCADSARKLGDVAIEAQALSYVVLVYCRQSNIEGAAKVLSHIDKIEQESPLPVRVKSDLQHVRGLFAATCEDWETAQRIWQVNLEMAEQFEPILRTNYQMWLAYCLHQWGKIEEARYLFEEAFAAATQLGYERAVAFLLFHLAAVDIDQGDFEQAGKRLESSHAKALKYQDRPLVADILLLYARLHTLRGDLPAARAALAEAIDLFERLGMRRELAEARAELAHLAAPAEAGH